MNRSYSVLIVSAPGKSADSLTEMLRSPEYAPLTVVGGADAARRLLVGKNYDIIVVNAPLPDDFGIQLALDLAGDSSSGVLMLVKGEMYDEACVRVSSSGVLVLPKPNTRQAILAAVRLVAATNDRLRAMEAKTENLRSRFEEMRLVNRAKWLLIDRVKMTEADAHRYIEKQAMDLCQRRRDVAESIIKMYEL